MLFGTPDKQRPGQMLRAEPLCFEASIRGCGLDSEKHKNVFPKELLQQHIHS